MTDTTITIPVGSDLNEELERVAVATGHSKIDVAVEALSMWLQDQSDARRADEVLNRNKPTTSLAEMRRGFDLSVEFSRTARRRFARIDRTWRR